MIVNPQDIETFYGQQSVPAAQSGGPAPGAPGTNPADYVIITTSTIVANSTKLASFITNRQAAGYTVKTVIEGAAQGDFAYVTGGNCDQRADNIRQWLVSYYMGDGIQYVLLIGDPHPSTFNSNTSIPMKMCWPRRGQGSDESAPSDMYFAELSGNWDLDSDTYYGEFSGDYGAGGADKNCELKVGRIPVYDSNYVNLDAILQKCIDYDTASTGLGYRSKVLIPAAVSNFGPQDNNGDGDASDPVDYPNSSYRTFGADWGEAVKSLASSASFSPYTLYEKSGVYADGSAYPLTACNANLNNANFINEWQNQYGFVTWWAHGSSTSASRFTWTSDGSYANICGNQPPHLETTWTTLISDTDCASLDDTTPSFVVQVSCYNAYPENSSNLGYSLLKQGAIGTISGTRVTWYAVGSWNTTLGSSYGDNASYGYYMFDEMGVNNNDIGTALVNCKSSFGTGWASGASWMNMVEFTLYGDPSLSLELTTSIYKWEQLPDETVNGIDIRCDISDGFQRTLADDFLCTTTGTIDKVVLWGSWKSDIKGQIQRIHLSIHSDDPIGPSGSDPNNTYSMPDQLLWQQDFTSADFVETLYKYDEPEWFWDPTVGDPPPLQYEHYQIWQYDISIDSNAFVQQGDPCNPVVYWLDAWVDILPDPCNPQFGWKTSTDHWNDDAVYLDLAGQWQELRYPIEHEFHPNSIDLSFRIITGEEEPNANVKWIQEPDLTPTGIDIRVDRMDGTDRTLADDFLCTTTGLITDVHLWGSWKYDEKGSIAKIHLSIHSDDPCGPGGSDPDNTYSKPDTLLWEMDFGPADFVESLFYTLPTGEWEWWWDIENGIVNPNGDTQVWKYDIYIDPADAFMQEGDPCQPVIYWLDVYVMLDDINYPGSEFGWKTSLDHWNDDAVYADVPLPPFNWMELRYPQGHEYEGESVDMAFAITTDANEPNEPNEPVVKYVQYPDLSEMGVDVDATLDTSGLSPWQPQILADDFNCTTTGHITDIHIWSSWYHDEQPAGDPNNVEFTLSIHSDIPVGDPCNPYTYSIPGEMLWVRDFLPGDFNSSVEESGIPEGYYVPCEPNYEPYADWTCWRYDFYIDPVEAFVQQGTPNEPIVYWLDVQARVFSETDNKRFGWKTSIDHWNDDAVWAIGDEMNHGPWQELRYPLGHQYEGESMDLAFAITTLADYNDFCYTGPQPTEWVNVGKPKCWCASIQPRQCHGDADNVSQGKNNYWVSTYDSDVLFAAWNKNYPNLIDANGAHLTINVGGKDVPLICADFDHLPQGKNNYRVSTNDLDILYHVANWQIKNGPAPDCP